MSKMMENSSASSSLNKEAVVYSITHECNPNKYFPFQGDF